MSGCEPAGTRPLEFDGSVLHLEEHLSSATITGSEIPTDIVRSVEWVGGELARDWRGTGSEGRVPWLPEEPAAVQAGDDGLLITAGERQQGPNGGYFGMATVPVDAWVAADWSHVVIRARATETVGGMGFTAAAGDGIVVTGDRVIPDGNVHTYGQVPWTGSESVFGPKPRDPSKSTRWRSFPGEARTPTSAARA
jgi:hypothetical protein